jgi:hypothetical protein
MLSSKNLTLIIEETNKIFFHTVHVYFLFKLFQDPFLHQKYHKYEEPLQTVESVPDCLNNCRRLIPLEVAECRHDFKQERNAHYEK